MLAGLVIGVLSAALVPPAGAGPGSLIAGACEVDLEVTTRTTGWREFVTPSAGTCLTTDGEADVWLDGEFGPFPTYDCLSGVGDGTANLGLDLEGGLSPGWDNTDLEVTNNGGVIELVLFQLGNPHIVASGHFVREPGDTLDCLDGGDTVMWSGVLVFEDPVIEAP